MSRISITDDTSQKPMNWLNPSHSSVTRPLLLLVALDANMPAIAVTDDTSQSPMSSLKPSKSRKRPLMSVMPDTFHVPTGP
jgi:hypothetical protein